MKLKVTGSIVTYNNSDVIEECVSTVLEQTAGLDFTLYLIDNASTDNTVKLVREKFPQVELICLEKNVGFGHGHNQVLDLLESDYHVVINPDISLSVPAVDELCGFLEENPQVAMATPRILNEDGSEQHLPKYGPTIRYAIISKFKPFKYLRRRYTRQDEMLSKPTDVEFCTGCFFVIRTAVFRRLEGFDRRFFMYCEDADLSRRVRQQARIVFYPETSAIHKWKRDNTRSIKGVMRFMTSLLKYFLKWGISF